MKLTDIATVAYPTSSDWAQFYGKFREALLNKLRRNCWSQNRCEDAVQEAFCKLMYRKTREDYGDRMPQTEREWFGALYWQARSYLSHLWDRGKTHERCIDLLAPMQDEVFSPDQEIESLDSGLRDRALWGALKAIQKEKGVSPRNFDIYLSRVAYGVPAKEVAKKHGIEPNNVDQIVSRVGKLVRKYFPRYYESAIQGESLRLAA